MFFIDFLLNAPSILWDYAAWFLDLVTPGEGSKLKSYAKNKLNKELPAELKGGRVVMSEVDISGRFPRNMHGRCDQVFERPRDKFWVLVDTKTRRYCTVYEKDIVQLSIYACILSSKKGVNVASTAFVRIVTPNRKPVYRKVRLYSPSVVAKIYDRRMAIKAGNACDLKKNSKLCNTCEFQSVCH